jgi:flagellar basal body-associated protein FliL
MKKETIKIIILGIIIVTITTLGVIYLFWYLVFNSFKEWFEANNYPEIGNCKNNWWKWNYDLWECRN